MAGINNYKLKTLYIMRYLEENTDDSHGATTEEIIEYLAQKGIAAERKSIYSDIELLRAFGLDIECRRGARNDYRLMSRTFQLPELKLLVDAVEASRFITRRKSLELIKKLEALTSRYEAAHLRRNVHVDRRVKSMNESIYYNVDAIHTAIHSDRMLHFQYFSYSRDKQRVLRRDGAVYTVSPLALTFSEGNYYLYAVDSAHEEVRSYRVDRMTATGIARKKRAIPPELQNFDPAAHTNEMFAMYSGERRTVTLSCANHLSTVMIDRFGLQTHLTPDGPDRFTVTTGVVISPNFLGWIFGFGADIAILDPADVAAEFSAMAHAAVRRYEPQAD